MTAIIGGTGAGKSTLVNLIPRFYDVDSGRVLVDGVDVREMSQEELRAKIGFVPQTAVLFSGTVAENIRFGNEDATDDEVRHAAEVAQATEFISEMGDGFDSSISQGGTNLSGGQKQRLSIARALVRQPEIYIFDDSFSALDYATDAQPARGAEARDDERHGADRRPARQHDHGRRPDHRAGRGPHGRHRHASRPDGDPTRSTARSCSRSFPRRKSHEQAGPAQGSERPGGPMGRGPMGGGPMG